MNCEKYQNSISAFVDKDLDPQSSQELETHLSICKECAKIREDFSLIANFYDENFTADSEPPNSQALWCRINNIIETEVQTELLEEKSKEAAESARPKRLWMRNWQFSPSQVFASVLGIALVSSLLTVIGIKNFSSEPDVFGETEVKENIFDQVLAKIGLVETGQQIAEKKVRQQKSAIAYWQKRVDIRRKQWDIHLRRAFDRNLLEIDKAVNEYTEILQKNPHDKISSEMLDSALNEKMEFLREFSEL